MRSWFTVRGNGDLWLVAFDDEALPCATRGEAVEMARELARQRWTDLNIPSGVRVELTTSGAPGEVLYGSWAGARFVS
jgi:hypothetical protein